MYGALPQSISAECMSVVLNPKSVNFTTTLRSRLSSSFPPGPGTRTSRNPSVTMKFSGLISRWKTPRSWHAATASHICLNMLAMSLSLVLESSLFGDIVASSEGVDGVRAVDSDDPEQSESDGDVDGSPPTGVDGESGAAGRAADDGS